MLKHIKSNDEWSEKSLGAKGFTLIELLVVVVILGILAAVVVFSVSGFTDDAQDNACNTEMRTLETAIEVYYAANGEWPDTLADLSPGYVRSAPTPANFTYSNTTGSLAFSGAHPDC